MTPDTRRATRRHPARFALLLCGLLAAVAAAPTASAQSQELYLYTVSALGTLGGSFDADPGDELSNTGFQLGVSYVTEPRTRVGVRAGSLGLGGGDKYNGLVDAELTYANVAGEYMFSEPYYDSWIFLGLGAYRKEGTPRLAGAESEETAIGGLVGVTGEFFLTENLDFIVEVSGHWVDFDDSQIFALGHAGVAFHF